MHKVRIMPDLLTTGKRRCGDGKISLDIRIKGNLTVATMDALYNDNIRNAHLLLH